MDQINGEDAIKNLVKALYSWKNQWPLPVWVGLTWFQYIYYVTQVWMGIGQGSANCATASHFQNILKIHSNIYKYWKYIHHSNMMNKYGYRYG